MTPAHAAPQGLPPGVGWARRPVGWPQALAVLLGTVTLWVGLAGAAGLWAYRHWEARLHITGQGVDLRLPRGLRAVGQTRQDIPTHLDVRPVVRVPIDQFVRVNIGQAFDVQVVIRADVPIDTVFRYDAVIPFATTLHTRAHVASWLPALAVSVPVKVDVPVHLSVPIHQPVALNLDTHLIVRIPHTLRVPLHTTFKVAVPLHADMRAQVIGGTDFSLQGPQEPWRLTVTRADVRLPLSAVRMEGHDAAADGSRSITPSADGTDRP